jgi:hypothetical protein
MTANDDDAGPGLNAYLFSENWLLAALFDMVEQHCSTTKPDHLDSFSGWSANARAIRLLAEDGLIEIESEDGDRITAHVLPKARELMRLVAIVEKRERQQG